MESKFARLRYISYLFVYYRCSLNNILSPVTFVIFIGFYRDILINGNDRVMRYFQLEDHDGIPTLKNKFQDLVNRIQWNSASFSADGEFVIGGTTSTYIYIYIL